MTRLRYLLTVNEDALREVVEQALRGTYDEEKVRKLVTLQRIPDPPAPEAEAP